MGCHFPVASHYTYVMSIYYTMRYDIGKCTTHTYVENPLQSDPHIHIYIYCEMNSCPFPFTCRYTIMPMHSHVHGNNHDRPPDTLG